MCDYIVLTGSNIHELMAKLKELLVERNQKIEDVILRNFLGLGAMPELHVYLGAGEQAYARNQSAVQVIEGESDALRVVDVIGSSNNLALIDTVADYIRSESVVKPIAVQFDVRSVEGGEMLYIRLVC